MMKKGIVFVSVFCLLTLSCKEKKENDPELQESIDIANEMVESIKRIDEASENLEKWESDLDTQYSNFEIENMRMGDSIINSMTDSLDITYDELISNEIKTK